MALKLTLLAVVLAVLVLYVHAQEDIPDGPSAESAEVQCKKNQEYLECGNRCDESQCKAEQKDRNCLTVCEPGCYCKKGTSRNYYRNCVPNFMCKYKNYIG